MYLLDERLFPMLEMLREDLGNIPLRITSGFRCPSHNAKVGGAAKSQHIEGTAVDIQSASGNIAPESIGYFAKNLGFRGIKVYNTWTHLDMRTGPIWHRGV